MAQPIYKVWFMKYKDPWYKLTKEEQNKLMQQNQESNETGGLRAHHDVCVSMVF